MFDRVLNTPLAHVKQLIHGNKGYASKTEVLYKKISKT